MNSAQFGQDEKLKIIQDLIAHFNLFAPERVLTPIGQITKLDPHVVNAFCNDTFKNKLSLVFNQNFKTSVSADIFEQIYACFTKQQEFTDTPEVLPQNILLNLNLKQPLSINPSLNNDKFTSVYSLPSAYTNILYLKNNRNPHYNFNYEISVPSTQYYRDYTITNSQISAGNINDRNALINNLFDIDVTQSYEANFDNQFKISYNRIK